MRPYALATLLLAPAALARPRALLKRDLATIQAAFANISSQVNTLDAGIKALTPSEDPATAVAQLTLSSRRAVVDALNAGTAEVTPTTALSIADAINLLSSSNTLVANVNSTVNDLIAQKPIVDGAGADGTVVRQLAARRSASKSFIAAVVSKVPSLEQNWRISRRSRLLLFSIMGLRLLGGRCLREGGSGVGV